ncbi:MAG: PQQ-dependent sugar dehydrogenase [Anaerolineae bacterium]|nr:PQQ-dependent sugar dehydrogenase [Anaerolineae bacterium]
MLVVDGLETSRDFTFLPDGRMLILQRLSGGNAAIRVFKNGTLLATNAWTTPVCDVSEQGLLGITPHPNFTTNNYIYVYYTAVTNPTPPIQCVGRLSRLTMTGDTAGSEDIVLTNIRSDYGAPHHSGDLKFGPDGYLYLTTGNTDVIQLSSETNNMNGKVIRILPDNSPLGYSTVGNPFHSAVGSRHCGLTALGSGPCREIIAYGLRNPFRMTIQPAMAGIPGTGNVWLGEVGGNQWEEINVVPIPATTAGNYGYPGCEGNCNTNGVVDPLYTYQHPYENGAAAIGGDFYTGTTYPAEYRNNYFFVDYVAGWIRRIAYVNGSWQAQTPPDFATSNSSALAVIGLQAGPNGDLYYLYSPVSSNSAEVRRIEYASNNLPPEARVSALNLNCAVNTPCTFDASASSDPNGDSISLYRWRVRYAGANSDVFTTNTTSPTLDYTFLQGTNATVFVRVDDANGTTSLNEASVTLFPGNQPATGMIDLDNLTEPGRTPSLTYHAGDRWSFAPITLNDPDGWGTTAPDSAITWSVVFHHNDHTHPFLPLVTTRTGQFTIPTNYHEDYRLWYRISLFITDARGQVTRIQEDVDPIVVSVNFNTVPFAVPITVDGLTFNPPNTTQFIAGTRFVLNTSASVTREGITYNFVNWSDSPTRTRTVTIPATATTFTANFGNATTAAPIRNRFSSTDTNLILTWLPVSGATGYEVQISPSSTFSTLVTVPGNPYAGTTLTMPMVPPGIYYWRVRALRAAPAAPSAWSTAEAFAVASP